MGPGCSACWPRALRRACADRRPSVRSQRVRPALSAGAPDRRLNSAATRGDYSSLASEPSPRTSAVCMLRPRHATPSHRHQRVRSRLDAAIGLWSARLGPGSAWRAACGCRPLGVGRHSRCQTPHRRHRDAARRRRRRRRHSSSRAPKRARFVVLLPPPHPPRPPLLPLGGRRESAKVFALRAARSPNFGALDHITSSGVLVRRAAQPTTTTTTTTATTNDAHVRAMSAPGGVSGGPIGASWGPLGGVLGAP